MIGPLLSRAWHCGKLLERKFGGTHHLTAGQDEIPPQRQALFASMIGLCAAIVFLAAQALLRNDPKGPWLGADFFQIWSMLQALRSGSNPYALGCPVIPPCADANQYYPITAGIAVWPLGLLTPALAAASFVGCSAALLAFGVLRYDRHRIALFLSYPFFIAVITGQWAPLIMSASLIRGMEWMYAAKPQLGLALFTARPSLRAGFLGCAFAGASLIVMPTWPLDWWRVASDSRYVGSPITHFAWFAPIMLLSILRWRTPEGRLLLALSLLPQTPYCYDQLLLWFVPRNRRDSLNLTWLSWSMFAAWRIFSYPDQPKVKDLATFAPYIMLFLFVPCLLMVLRHPNSWASGRVSPDNEPPSSVELPVVTSHP